MFEAPHSLSPIERVHRRPVLIFDLMVLVVAVALTLTSPAIMKAIVPADLLPAWERRDFLIGVVSLVLTLWTALLVPLTLLGKRSGLRRASRGYGTSACFASASALLLLAMRQVPPTLWLWGVYGPSSDPVMNLFFSRLKDFLYRSADACAPAIIAVWFVLALSGVGRKPSNWFELLGCIFGLLWVLWYLVNYILLFLELPWLRQGGVPW